MKTLILVKCLVCFCFSGFFVGAQDIDDLDSLLVDRDIENYSIRLFTNYKVNKFTIENSGARVKFVPNNRHGIGIGVANKKIILDIAFNLKNPNKEATRRFDLQGTTIFKNRHYINLYVQAYKGFQAKSSFEDVRTFRQDLRSSSFGLNYLYTFDDIEFSYSLLKAGLSDKNAKDVFITGGVGGFGIFDYFSSDAPFLSEIAEPYFNEQGNIKRYQGVAVGVMGGVITYFRLPENISATLNLIPGIGLIHKKITSQDDVYRPSNPMLYKLDFSLGLAYNLEQYYVSLTYHNGFYSTSFDNGNTYSLNISKAKLAIGYKFGTRNKYKRKQSLF